MLKKTVIVLLLLFLAACAQSIPREALELSPESLQMRQIQTRYFDTKDEAAILSASAALLQDLGFNIDKSESKLGFILGSKNRDATSAAQVTGALLLALMGVQTMAIDKTQLMRACIITYPQGESRERIAVRVTFQRIVWNTQGQVTTKEGLTEPGMYQEFFSKLSKSVFLEANQI